MDKLNVVQLGPPPGAPTKKISKSAKLETRLFLKKKKARRGRVVLRHSESELSWAVFCRAICVRHTF